MERPSGDRREEQVNIAKLKAEVDKNSFVLPFIALLSPNPSHSGLPDIVQKIAENSFFEYGFNEVLRDQSVQEIIAPALDQVDQFKRKTIREVTSQDPFVPEVQDLLKQAQKLLRKKNRPRSNTSDPLIIKARAYNDVANVYGRDVLERAAATAFHSDLEQQAVAALHQKELMYKIFADEPKPVEDLDAVKDSIKHQMETLQTEIFRDTLFHFYYDLDLPRLVYRVDSNSTPQLVNSEFITSLKRDETEGTHLTVNGTKVRLYTDDYDYRFSTIDDCFDLSRRCNISPSGFVRDGKLPETIFFTKRYKLEWLLGDFIAYMQDDNYKALNEIVADSENIFETESHLPFGLRNQSERFKSFYNWYTQMMGKGYVEKRDQMARRMNLPAIRVTDSSRSEKTNKNSTLNYGDYPHSKPREAQLPLQDVTLDNLRIVSKDKQKSDNEEKRFSIEGYPYQRRLDALYLPTSQQIEESEYSHYTFPRDWQSSMRVQTVTLLKADNEMLYLPSHPDFLVGGLSIHTEQYRFVHSTDYSVERDRKSHNFRVRLKNPGLTNQSFVVSYNLLENENETLSANMSDLVLDGDKLQQVNDMLKQQGLSSLAETINSSFADRLSRGSQFTLGDLEAAFLEASVYTYNIQYKPIQTEGNEDKFSAFTGFYDPRSEMLHIQCDEAAYLYSIYLNEYFSRSDYSAEPVVCYKVPYGPRGNSTVTAANVHARTAIKYKGNTISLRDTTPASKEVDIAKLSIDIPAQTQVTVLPQEPLENELIKGLHHGWGELTKNTSTQQHISLWARRDETEPLVAIHSMISTLQNIISDDSLSLNQDSSSKEQQLIHLQERVVKTKEIISFLVGKPGSAYNQNIPSSTILQASTLLNRIGQTINYLANKK